MKLKFTPLLIIVIGLIQLMTIDKVLITQSNLFYTLLISDSSIINL